MIGAIAPSAAADTRAAPAPEKIRETAADFEALLVSQLLRMMREAGGGWLGGGGDAAAESILELAEQQLSKVLAARGGLGLAGLVARGLDRKRASE